MVVRRTRCARFERIHDPAVERPLQLKPAGNEDLMANKESHGMSTEAERETTPAPARGPSTIVLIEPDGLIRGLITEWLTLAGHVVRPGYRGDGADVEEVDAVII